MHRILHRLLLVTLFLVLPLRLAAVTYTANEGQTVTFSVTAAGTAPFVYQWYKDGVEISGATSATYAISSAAGKHAGNYQVRVANGAGVATSSADLTVIVQVYPPSITTQPTGQSVYVGNPVTFTVAATGTATLKYQWFKDGTAITGATSATYSIASAALGNIGSYTVSVTNDIGTVTSNAAALAVSNVPAAPTIDVQPVAMNIVTGQTASLSVTASGTGPLSYQWYKGATLVTGATSSTYTFTNATSGMAGSYSVKVSNSLGNVTSNVVSVNVVSAAVAPTINVDLVDVTIDEGEVAEFKVVPSGSAPFTYQWMKNGVVIAGATGSTYRITSAAASDSGDYTVKITNSAGNVTSSIGTLTVNAQTLPPTITQQPASLTVTAGQPAQFSLAATGSGTLTYQWMKDGVDIPGATSATYSIASATNSSAGTYTVIVFGEGGNDLSDSAVLTVTSTGTGGSGGVAPIITSQPVSTTLSPGQSATMSVTVAGSTAALYQWYKDGAAIPGATSATYTIASVSASSYGNYTVAVTINGTTTVSQGALLQATNPGRLSNLSVRSVAGRDGQPLIVGFATVGSSDKQVLVRATGPALAAFGVPGVLADPKLALYSSANALLGQNDNWADGGKATAMAALFQRLGAFAIADTASKDTALLTTFTGTRTVHVNSNIANQSGVVLVEAYDADTVITNELCNASALNYVGTGGEILIMGFVITGDSPVKVLIRGVGPTLGNFGVSGLLADPTLQLHRIDNGVPTLITENDNWDGTTQTAAIFTSSGAFGLPAGSKDAALVVTLNPGAYTASVSGKASTTGTAIVELYAVK